MSSDTRPDAGIRPDPPTVLVVEDDYLLASSLRASLVMCGFSVMGPYPGVGPALDGLARASAPPDAALLDVNLRDETSFPVVDALQARHVPVLLTGYDATSLPQRYRRLPRFQKPVNEAEIERAVRDVMDGLA